MSASNRTPKLKLPLFRGDDTTSWMSDFNGAMNILDGLLDIFYPVGSYYETSDTSFDPNTAWGGTWQEDTAGLVLVAKDDSTFSTVGATGGEKTHKLTVNEMPAHTHSYSGFPYNTTGTWADPYRKLVYMNESSNPYPNQAGIDSAGGSQSHNNLQPYVVVKRWHRTA